MTKEELSRSSVARALGVDLEAGPRPARRRSRLAWAGVAVLLAAVAIAWSRADSGSAVQYRTLPAERGDLRVTVTATGAVEPTKTVDVGCEVSGTIVQVLVDEDDHVNLGVPFILAPSIVTVAFLFSAGVGMVFGYFPAQKAARLDPIDALRYE